MKPETIEIVKSTAPVVKEYGAQITQRMYEIAFEARPDLRRFFENTWMKDAEEGRKQASRLAGAVYAYASHIDDLEAISGPVEHIAKVHVKSKIIPEMYPAIGECLLAAMEEVLGEAATQPVLDAWREAYGALADVFVNREKELYEEEDRELFAPKDAAS